MAVHKKLSYCDITKSASNIIAPYIDSEKHSWYKQYGGYHTGVDIEGLEIYSYQSGVVTQIGKLSDMLYAIVIQYTASTSLRYANMSSVCVKQGDVIRKGQLIGIAKKFVHFEYLTKDKGTSIWPVRVGGLTYFKQNPEGLLDGSIQLNANDWSQIKVANTTSIPYELRDAQISEFGVCGKEDGE